MNVCVTGSNGFIGKNLVGTLSKRGHLGWAVARTFNHSLPAGWQFVQRDEFHSGISGIHPDVIIHLEAKHHVFHETKIAKRDLNAVNVGGTLATLETASQIGCLGFIYFSSIKATESTLPIEIEDNPRPGKTTYGRTKWEAEKLVQNWVQQDQRRWAVILRPSVVYGPGSTANMYQMLDSVNKGKFPLINGGKNIKSIVSLQNVCTAVNFILGKTNTGTSVFNVTDPQAVTVKTIAVYMADALGVPHPSKSLPLSVARIIASFGDFSNWFGFSFWPLNSNRLAGLTEDCYYSPEKLLSVGYHPYETTQQGIKQFVDWYKKQN